MARQANERSPQPLPGEYSYSMATSCLHSPEPFADSSQGQTRKKPEGIKTDGAQTRSIELKVVFRLADDGETIMATGFSGDRSNVSRQCIGLVVRRINLQRDRHSIL